MYPRGALVRVKPGQLDSFQSDEARKLTDRVGIVTGHTAFYSHPIVQFPAVGRRTEHQRSFMHSHAYLDKLTDETEIAKWVSMFAEEKEKAAKALEKKREAFKRKAEKSAR